MTRIVVYPHSMASSGAKEVARGLGAKRVHPDGAYWPRRGDLIINWGSSHSPQWNMRMELLRTIPLNHWASVQSAINKLKAFVVFRSFNVPHVPFTTRQDVALKWLAEGQKVIGRHKLTGTGGEGIEFITPDSLVCPLYTQLIPKKREFRVHVFRGKMIDASQKKKKRGVEADPYIKSHDRGWVFCNENVEVPKKVEEAAIQAVKALGLDFGGVDVLYCRQTDSPFVLEVNTAPGLEGGRIESYVKAFQSLVG